MSLVGLRHAAERLARCSRAPASACACISGIQVRDFATTGESGSGEGPHRKHEERRGPAGDSRSESDRMVDFGFQMVSEGLKSSLVRDVFKSVAPSYDVMNDLMSGGLHRLWKDQVVDMLGPFRGMSHLDVAGGTGDIASRVVRAINAYPEGLQAERAAGGRSRVVVSDINEDMLEVGRKREWAQQTGCVDVEWAVADAENLPFPDNEFDAYTVAFGIRNVTRRDKALREAHRVLKRGGRFLCLEFSHVEDEFLSKAYDAYSFHVIPAIGQAVAGDAKSYEYLVESIRQFPNAEDFAREVRGAGFRAVSHETLTMGVVAIHSGFKL